MRPFQWSSTQRIVAFSRDITVSTSPVRPGLVSFRGVLRSVEGPKLPGEVAGQKSFPSRERYFIIRIRPRGADNHRRILVNRRNFPSRFCLVISPFPLVFARRGLVG